MKNPFSFHFSVKGTVPLPNGDLQDFIFWTEHPDPTAALDIFMSRLEYAKKNDGFIPYPDNAFKLIVTLSENFTLTEKK